MQVKDTERDRCHLRRWPSPLRPLLPQHGPPGTPSRAGASPGGASGRCVLSPGAGVACRASAAFPALEVILASGNRRSYTMNPLTEALSWNSSCPHGMLFPIETDDGIAREGWPRARRCANCTWCDESLGRSLTTSSRLCVLPLQPHPIPSIHPAEAACPVGFARWISGCSGSHTWHVLKTSVVRPWHVAH